MRQAAAGAYSPRRAWRRAGVYFAACVLIAGLSGVLQALLSAPLFSGAQLRDPYWLAFTALCVAVIVVGYAVIWPRGTFTDGRERHPLLAPTFGAAWGACQGLLFLSIWSAIARSGLAAPWVAVLSYFCIGGYNALWHRAYWDIQVSPPHNYSEWNVRKVLLCHTPNLICCLAYLALYNNAGIFVLLQATALALSAFFMRFPAWWDDYSAEPGLERSLGVSR